MIDERTVEEVRTQLAAAIAGVLFIDGDATRDEVRAEVAQLAVDAVFDVLVAVEEERTQ